MANPKAVDHKAEYMNLKKVDYKNLNARQKEIYNFQKLAAVLADYGFNCIRLTDDWQGADFLAYHKDETDTLKVQLKSRLTIKREYMDKNLFLAFPLGGGWCLIQHDLLIDLVGEHTTWLRSRSWLDAGIYSSVHPNRRLMETLGPYVLTDG